MNLQQREFLTWWLINYGEAGVNFYKIRDQYIDLADIDKSEHCLWDGDIHVLFDGKNIPFGPTPATLPQHIIGELNSDQENN